MFTTIPVTMRAIAQRAYGGVDTLERAELPVPTPRADELLIRIDAAALNPADAYLMKGTPWVVRLGGGLRRPSRMVRGLDCAGTVVAVGAKVRGLRTGDAVLGEARGALAEYAIARADRLSRRPSNVGAVEGAASVMAGLTAIALLRKAGLVRGKRVLINGASGGIGHLAVQLAVAAGAEVTAVCGSRNVDWVRDLGAVRVIDHSRESVLDAGGGFDIVLDNVGDHRLRDVERLAVRGGAVAPNSGAHGPDGGALRRVMLARWRALAGSRRIVSLVSTTRTPVLEDLATLLAAGTLRPRIDTVYPLDDAAAAMARIVDRHVAGKVVVVP